MSNFIVTRELIKRLYGKYEVYINPVAKFILSMIILSVINSHIGYMDRIDNIVVVLVASLLCSFLPMQIMVVIAGLFILLHMYALAPECALVVGVLFLLMFLLYVRLVPKEAIVLLLTPVLYMLKIPYIMPIAMGLLGTPVSAVSVGFGVVAAYFLEYMQNNATTITSLDEGNMISRIRFIVDGLLGNKAMFVTVIVFAVIISLVYVIRRRSMDYAWTVAVIAGGVTELVLLFICELIFELNYPIGGIIFGCILAVIAGIILQLFSFHLDYKRVENVQFEDDDYYYYVKAVPKVTVSAPNKKVKRVQSSSSGHGTAQRPKSQTAPAHGKTAAASSGSSARTVHTANGTSRTIR